MCKHLEYLALKLKRVERDLTGTKLEQREFMIYQTTQKRRSLCRITVLWQRDVGSNKQNERHGVCTVCEREYHCALTEVRIIYSQSITQVCTQYVGGPDA